MLLAVVAGCSSDGDRSSTLAAIRDSAGIRVLTVPAPGSGPIGSIPSAGEWGRELPLMRVLDARSLPDMRIGILDGGSREVWLINARSGETSTISVGAAGPGQSSAPTALFPLNGSLAIWDTGRRAINIFSVEGPFETQLPQPDVGDLGSFRWREDARLEDLRMRIKPSSDGIWIQVEESEHVARDRSVRGPQRVARRGYVTRLRPSGSSDTVLVYQATTRLVDPGGPSYSEGVLQPRALWAVNDGDLAYGRSDTAEIRVYDGHGEPTAILRWQPRHVVLDVESKRAHARAYVIENPDLFPTDLLDPDQVTGFNSAADRVRIVEVAPEFSAVELRRECLWVSEFNLRDNSDGLSRTWSYYNLRTGAAGSVRFDTIAAALRIMDIDGDHALGRVIDQATGVHAVRRYVLPVSVRNACGGTQSWQPLSRR